METMPVLRRRRGRRPKIDKLLEASALESMIAANTGAANLAGTLSSAGLGGGLNMLWPMAGFEQCLSRLADANMAERNRLLLGESGQAVPHDDAQRTSSGLSGGEHEEQPPRSAAAETNVGSLDLRALLNKEAPQQQHSASRPADGESDDIPATSAEAGDDSQPKDVLAPVVTDADIQKDTRLRDADAEGVNLTSEDKDQRGIDDRHSVGRDHVEEPEELPLKLTASMATDHGNDVSVGQTPSRDVSHLLAGDMDEDLVSSLRGSDDVVARWLAEHRNTFDRQGLEDEVQSEVRYHYCCRVFLADNQTIFELTVLCVTYAYVPACLFDHLHVMRSTLFPLHLTSV